MKVKKPSQYLKIAVLGDAGVGKTSLCTRLTKDCFHPGYELTVGLHIHSYVVEFDGHPHRVLLYDVAGQPRFGDMLDLFIKGSVGALLLFDCCSILTFFSLEEIWLPFIKQHLPNIPIVLVGNKIDQSSYVEVTENQIETFLQNNASEVNLVSYIKTSAKTGIHVEDMIREILAACNVQPTNVFLGKTNEHSQSTIIETQGLSNMLHSYNRSSFTNPKADED